MFSYIKYSIIFFFIGRLDEGEGNFPYEDLEEKIIETFFMRRK